MYQKVSTDLNFVDREKEVEKFWEEHHIFEKKYGRKGRPRDLYVLTTDRRPLTASPHIGHVLTRVIKDMIPRYRTMKGYEVPRKAGWDTHGLAGRGWKWRRPWGWTARIRSRNTVWSLSFNKCKESVWKYKGMWGGFLRHRRFLGGYGKSIRYVPQ